MDEAIIFGVNRPAEWQNDVITMARQAGNNVAASSGITYDLADGPHRYAGARWSRLDIP